VVSDGRAGNPRVLMAAPQAVPSRFHCRFRSGADELPGAGSDGRADVLGLEHDRLPAVGEDLADEPVRAPDAQLGHRLAVLPPEGALLDLPPRDVLAVQNPDDAPGRELVRGGTGRRPR